MIHEPSDLAMKIVKAIKAEYTVGNASSFCDEVDWDDADDEDLAKIIDGVLSEEKKS